MSRSEPLEVKISEKYYIEKGQGIEQLLAVSLDESIRLHDFPSFIQLKGEIVLEGEYASENKDHDDGERHQFPQKKYMQSIQMLDNGVAYFRQIIPIDITIPKSNIKHIDDIQVEIKHFDYSIPTPYIFILFATVQVNGIVKENISLSKEKESINHVNQIKEKEVERIEEEEPEENVFVEHDEIEQISEELLNKDMPEEMEHSEVVDAVQEEIEEIEEVEKVEEVEELEQRTMNQQEIHYTVISGEDNHVNDNIRYEAEIEEQSDEQQLNERSFLTELFGEDTIATVTKYVVQTDDSVESIAEKFEITPSELMKNNHLHVSHVNAGDVLSIYR